MDVPDSSRQVFRFLHLPYELRSLIHEYLFSSTIIKPRLHGEDRTQRKWASEPHTILNFMLSCRQTYAETKDLFWKLCIFDFVQLDREPLVSLGKMDCDTDFPRLTSPHYMSLENLYSMRRFRVSSEFMYSLGFLQRPYHADLSPSRMSLWKMFPQLDLPKLNIKELTIEMRTVGPINCGPWREESESTLFWGPDYVSVAETLRRLQSKPHPFDVQLDISYHARTFVPVRAHAYRTDPQKIVTFRIDSRGHVRDVKEKSTPYTDFVTRLVGVRWDDFVAYDIA